MKISGLRTKKFQIKSSKGDILPLMDCMFILLIYFVFVMIDMVEHPGLKLHIPQSYTSHEISQSFNSLSVTKEGELFLNKKKIQLKNLEEELQIVEINDTRFREEDKKIFIKGDQKANTHQIFNLMETLRKIDRRSVFIETKEK